VACERDAAGGSSATNFVNNANSVCATVMALGGETTAANFYQHADARARAAPLAVVATVVNMVDGETH